MPRFLNTWTGEFEWHSDPKRVSYAILSHTWRSPENGGEQSYDDVRALQATVNAEARKHRLAVSAKSKCLEFLKHFSLSISSPRPTILTHPKLSDKIKGICKVAREAGFQLIWVDSCCIDKTSSAELSEAINSMFEWYRLSDKCYVYLEDVPNDEDPSERCSSFWKSRWHTRCWTLQELIVPADVEFRTQTWHLLGTKVGLSRTLGKITGVDFDILTGNTTVHSVSVARRMSWAAKREATRVEDQAYSLMGLFDIHMSPIYGEGDHAFLRLQEEIIKTIPDQSIFAWGRSCALRSLSYCVNITQSLPAHPGLFASSPFDFKDCRDITPLTPSRFASRLRLKASEASVPPLHCVLTPQGARVRLLCLNFAVMPRLINMISSEAEYPNRSCSVCMITKAEAFAFIQCEDKSRSLIALPLCHPREAGGGREMFIGTHIQCTKWCLKPFRVVRLNTKALTEILGHISPTTVEVSLLRHYLEVQTGTSLAFPSAPTRLLHTALWSRKDHEDRVSFRITTRSIKTLGILGFVADSERPLQVERSTRKIALKTVFAYTGGDGVSQHGGHPQTVRITLELTQQEFSHQDDTMARFSVVNLVGVPKHATRRPQDLRRIIGQTPLPPYILKEIPCTDRRGGRGRLSTFDSRDRWRRVSAEAEFTLYSNVDWEQGQTASAQLLRIAFGSLLDDSGDSDGNVLWLSVYISEKYQHTQSIDRPLDGTSSEAGGPPSQVSGRGSSEECRSSATSPATAMVVSLPPEHSTGSRSTPTRILLTENASVWEAGGMLRPRKASSGTDFDEGSAEESPCLAAAHSAKRSLTSSFKFPVVLERLKTNLSDLVEDDSVGAVVVDAETGDPGLESTRRSGRAAADGASRAEEDLDGVCDAHRSLGTPTIERPPPPCAVRPKISSNLKLAAAQDGEQPYWISTPPSTHPGAVRDLVSEEHDAGRRESPHAFQHEDDTERAPTSATSSQISHLVSKNAALTAQNAALSSQVTVLSSEMAAMSSQMAVVLARLDALTSQSGMAPAAQREDARLSWTCGPLSLSTRAEDVQVPLAEYPDAIRAGCEYSNASQREDDALRAQTS